ncbi:MAG: hypothetical protein D6704_05900 [Nitrospirae bacterium]|nr:MAG: hypothetical protein D6704_05900 [Nitrospirota bacterium]
MIYFRTKPDAVFLAIVEEALQHEITEISLLGDSAAITSWEGLYPQSAARFTPYSAVLILRQLLAVHRDTRVYRLPNSYWLLLYECLKNFCLIHNDYLDEYDQGAKRTIGNYTLGELDADAMVAIYFWDTDFLLLSQDETGDPTVAGEHEPGSDQDWLVAETMPLLEVVEEVAWHVPAPNAYFRSGSRRYPDTSNAGETTGRF